jgi:wyosine [tRNA(Phe)-imidazoG37] synthetase (radical SAM superfamily)
VSSARIESGRQARRDLLVKEDVVYGPLHSRRLGRSLGINLLGSGDKICSFNCRYCQCGWTKCPAMALGRRVGDLPSAYEVTRALEAKLQDLSRADVSLDAMTFSGNGEPTLHPEFGEIVDTARALRDRYAPRAKVAVLSNSSSVHRPEVRAALERCDLKVMKLDAGTERLMRRINLPARGFDFARMIQGLAKLKGVVLQSMFVSGSVNNTDPPAVREWLERIAEIRPVRVQAYSFDRTAPDPGLMPAPRRLLASIAQYAGWRTGVAIDVF